MQKTKLSAQPPISNNDDIRASFIQGAERVNALKEQPSSKPSSLPWHGNMVREDIKRPLTINLPEPFILKLKFISENTNKSQQKIAREILCSEIDKLLKEIIA